MIFALKSPGVNSTLSTTGDGWELHTETVTEEKDLELFHFRLKSLCGKRAPERVRLDFRIPFSDCQVKWQPAGVLAESHHFLPDWWRTARSSLSTSAPVASYFNQAGLNRLTLGLSEARYQVDLATGPNNDGLEVHFAIFDGSETAAETFEFTLRMDYRSLFYADALRDLAKWYETIYPPLPVPEIAFQPLYSTWYQYQKDVSARELEHELPWISRMNFTTLLLDDGWQCERITGGGLDMTTCGDWKPFPGKFADMKGHVARCQNKNLRYLLWIALPYVGKNAKIFEQFCGKFLKRESGSCNTLDPRYPEVRTYLLSRMKQLIQEFGLNGLKIDFLDSFYQPAPEQDPAAANGFAGCDYHNVHEALEELLRKATAEFKKFAPDFLVEFRQRYTGPAMRQYGNIFRASDCAFDLLENRVRTIDLRLLAGGSAVHSDMLAWSPEDTPEVAALQILNVLFSVPQLSVRLASQSEKHLKMLEFWLNFCCLHQSTLLKGRLVPEHPELSYPVVSAEGDSETITVVYESRRLVSAAFNEVWIVVNATHAPDLLIELPSGEYNAEILDVFGQIKATVNLQCGIHPVSVPCSGFLRIDKKNNRKG